MSETAPTEDATRPWHGDGATSPFESLYRHFKAEIDAIRAKVQALEADNTHLRAALAPEPATANPVPAEQHQE
jgi:hypothetical protein